MASIIKSPSKNEKGIIIFTHKEIKFFLKFWKKTRFEFFNNLQLKFLGETDFKGYVKNAFESWSKNYYIGIHYGWYHEDIPKYDFIDFYMGGLGTVKFRNPDQHFWIPLNSRNFSKDFFKPDPEIQKKHWDLITVSRTTKFKNVDKFLKSVRKIYDSGKKYKILAIMPQGANETEKSHYVNLVKDYYEMFTPEERGLFTLMRLSPQLSLLGLSQESLAFFYQNSKVFTLYSQLEGESRVISEALMSGLKVVVKSDLTGGGRDLLHEQNSMLFDSYEDAHTTLIKAIESEPLSNDEIDKIHKATGSANNIKLLVEHFEKLYKKNGSTFTNSNLHFDNMSMDLPGHNLDVPWCRSIHGTADIISKGQFDTFKSHIDKIGVK